MSKKHQDPIPVVPYNPTPVWPVRRDICKPPEEQSVTCAVTSSIPAASTTDNNSSSSHQPAESCPPTALQSSRVSHTTTSKEHLVVDAGAFIRLKQLHTFGFQRIHVTPGVAAEIRDATARHNLNFMLELPTVDVPTEKDIKFARKFAEETGDLGFLSETDIEVIALTYMLQRLTGDVRNLKARPTYEAQTVENVDGNKVGDWGSFPWGVKQNCVLQLASKEDKEDEAEESLDDSDESDADSGGWINEENLEEFRMNLHASLDGDAVDGDSGNLRVACLSTDYSVQNVLVQMGLSVLSIDGMRIRAVKKWSLLCRACKPITIHTTKKFCGHCGNATLKRVPMNVNIDGTISVERPPKNSITGQPRRMKNVTIPRPQGGRTGGLILCEDHIYISGRDRLLRRQQKLLEKERELSNPFHPDNYIDQVGWHHKKVPAAGNVKLKYGPCPITHQNHHRRKKH